MCGFCGCIAKGNNERTDFADRLNLSHREPGRSCRSVAETLPVVPESQPSAFLLRRHHYLCKPHLRLLLKAASRLCRRMLSNPCSRRTIASAFHGFNGIVCERIGACRRDTNTDISLFCDIRIVSGKKNFRFLLKLRQLMTLVLDTFKKCKW